MRAIIIGAGRGNRLMPTTADSPKCFAEVAGQRLIDWTVTALRESGIQQITFVGGYRIERVRECYPDFEFRENTNWPQNNILASLFYAEDVMDEPFVCCYSDTLFNAAIVKRLMDSDATITLAVDTAWLDRYRHRTEHPSDDAEKVTVEDGQVTRIHRDIPEAEAYGEYLGLAKFSADGAAALRRHYHRAREEFAGQPWRGATTFEKAYKIHLLQEMVESRESMRHVDTHGGYIEVDTQQDFDYAKSHWVSQHLRA